VFDLDTRQVPPELAVSLPPASVDDVLVRDAHERAASAASYADEVAWLTSLVAAGRQRER
jgi:hypothetical protein